ncbi:MAG: methyl-accepting chemotaxis protein [Aquabacterium sp.]|nr:methyl-accepting chemotaxis protein [Aquabacterium sp.]
MALNDFNIGTRLTALSVTLLLGVLLTGGGGIYALKANLAVQHATAMKADGFETAIDSARSGQVAFKAEIQEWKNLLLRGTDPAAYEKHKKGLGDSLAEADAKLSALQSEMGKLGLSDEAVKAVRPMIHAMSARYDEGVKAFDPADPSSAKRVDAMVKGVDRAPNKGLDDIVDALMAESDKSRHQMLAEADQQVHTMTVILVVLVSALACFGGVASWLIMRSIKAPLNQALASASAVADGRLDGVIDMTGSDEISQLNAAMNRMNGSLQDVVSKVRVASSAVSYASDEIASGNVDLSSRTELQAANLQQAASTIDQISKGVKDSADSADQAHGLAAQASDIAERGGVVVGQVVQTMSEINSSSRKISEIIGVIDGIAFQTNILALNAAVEAARAGDQGRGFAVVASEVRSLAQRSANAAKEIKVLINASFECVDRGSALVVEAGSTISSTVDAVNKVRDVVAEIKQVAREQATGISQVSQSIGGMDDAMQKSAALVEETAAAALSLKNQAHDLDASVAFFRT